RVAVLSTVFVLTLVPWTVRNWKVHGAFIPVSTVGGFAVYGSFHPPQGKYFGVYPDDEVVAQSESIASEVERSKFFMAEGIKFLRQHPEKIPKLEVLKLLFFWSPFDWEIIGEGLYNPIYGWILPLSIVGMILSLKRPRQEMVLCLILPIVYYQILSLVFYGSPRTRVLVEPFLVLFASFAAWSWIQKSPQRSLPIFAVWILVNLALFLYSPDVKTGAAQFLHRVGLW
ncbi:MAG: hypothetical protein HY694_08780, partial [Deltaproteobacteria bacterium]|nr:hypothetical protein [Deltaproteobacteria bacterium]